MSVARFGVVIPTRDRPRQLERAVQTVQRQEFEDWRMAVVDDASDPAALEANRALVDGDARCRLIALEQRCGAATARNRGVQSLDVDYLAFMDDDCWWAPDRLARLDRALDEAPVPPLLAYTRMVTVGPRGDVVVHGRIGTGPFTGGWRVGTPMLVARRSHFLEVGGFDETLPRLQDFDLVLRLMLRRQSLFVPDAVVWHGETPGISSDSAALRAASRRLADKYRCDRRLDRRDWAFMHRELAYRFMTLGARGEAVRHYALAARRHPEHPVHWGGLAAALLGKRAYHWLTRLVEVGRRPSTAVREADAWSPPAAPSSPPSR